MNPIDRPDRIDETHWQAQEKARRGEPDADPAELRIARALRRPPPVQLPAGFAAQVAAVARVRASAPAAAPQDALERRLLRALVLVLALASAVVVAWYGRGWASGLAAVLPGGHEAVAWSAVAALCLLGNWGLDALRRGGMHALR